MARAYMGVYKHPRPLYTLKKQIFIYSLVRVELEETMNYNEYVNLTWDDFPLSVGIEYALISMGKSTPIREQKVADAIGLGINA
jgi:hypothetical protein